MLTERVLCRELLVLMANYRRGTHPLTPELRPPVKSAVSFIVADERRSDPLDIISKQTLSVVARSLLEKEHHATLARQDGEIVESYDGQTLRLRWEREPYNQTKFVAEAYPYALTS